MNNNLSKTSRTDKKIRSSITKKLTWRFFWRLVSIFVSLDVFLVCAFSVSSVVYAEWTAASVASSLAQAGGLTEAPDFWPGSGVDVVRLDRAVDGFIPPSSLWQRLPQSTAVGARRLSVPDGDDSYLKRLEGLYYTLEFTGEPSYGIIIHLGDAVRTAKITLTVLLVLQALTLLNNYFRTRTAVQKALGPIEELTLSTYTLNASDHSSLSPEKMAALTGKLDSIDAGKLDIRLSLDGTQDELKGLATAINSMLDRINASYRSQVRFVSDASHELRTPIAVIQGYANLLDRWGKKDEKTLQESIDAIKDEAANMKALVEQLLFLARGDNDTMPLKIERFELSELAEEACEESKMIDAGHEYSCSLSPAWIFADKGLIKQALRIMLDNAIKYTDTGGQIALSVKLEGAFVSMSVKDSGIGIPPEAIEHIFDRFFRADQSRARATGGAGLGLSIAKWIAQRHGGHMEVLSRQDIGTKISLVLPAASDQSAPPPPSEEEESEDKTA
ncbi:MAG: ATP-binding protein [Eubacteriales bacterium]